MINYKSKDGGKDRKPHIQLASFSHDDVVKMTFKKIDAGVRIGKEII